MATLSRHRIGRRAILAAGGAAIGSGAITGFPTIWAQNIKNVTLRQFGTGVSNLNAVADKVKQDLGFTLQMTALDTDAVTQKAVTQPKSYDIADIEYFAIKKVFPTGVHAADGCEEDQALRQDRADLHQGQAHPGRRDGAGHRPLLGRLRRWPQRAQLRQGPDRLDDPDPHHLQRRHAGHPPRPGRPADQQLEGPGRPRLQGQAPPSSTSPPSASWTPPWSWSRWAR